MYPISGYFLDVFMCPSDWEKIGNRCFNRTDSLKTWRKSFVYCQQLGQGSGSLASIRSSQEQSVLSKLLSTSDAWIGLNDIDNEGFYVWVDSSPLPYVNWNSAEKKNCSMRISHSCVAANGKFWKTKNCLAEKQSVCVMPAVLGRKELC